MRFLAFLAVVFCAAMASLSARAETIGIAFIDPLSGPAAAVTQNGLNHFRFMAERLSDAKLKFEVTGYDNKLSPQETIVQAQKAIDAGIRFIAQGNGSAAAAALADFVVKHNERNPDARVLYLNYAAIDPALTNEKCSPWHFRFDAHAGMKMLALAKFIKTQPQIRKVYLINQDYSFGRAVRDAALAMLKTERPDIEIVGDELHPLAKINDFSPYVAKIAASGADSVITGNWGSDLALLLKAAGDAHLKAGWYTYYASGIGSPTAVKQSGLEHRVYAVIEGHANLPMTDRIEDDYRARFGGGFVVPRIRLAMEMLKAAIVRAGSTDADRVAAAMAGAQQKTMYGGIATLRPADHQVLQDLYVASFGPRNASMHFDEENTGWGWKTAGMVKAADTALPTTCVMPQP
ncbi:branched-chain amino acid ABC transporter substrate-binding protein [Ferrovibrio xuzhouensis]|uniref:Branched-chain amino acid ABC transporter substrate-binding protein n=1 Tax=Ferrovibrio xuzhouensis TaxID=1576914 RepID=A0ABV7VDP9_9PROT